MKTPCNDIHCYAIQCKFITIVQYNVSALSDIDICNDKMHQYTINVIQISIHALSISSVTIHLLMCATVCTHSAIIYKYRAMTYTAIQYNEKLPLMCNTMQLHAIIYVFALEGRVPLSAHITHYYGIKCTNIQSIVVFC